MLFSFVHGLLGFWVYFCFFCGGGSGVFECFFFGMVFKGFNVLSGFLCFKCIFSIGETG